jgi:CspA family cold shock protein
MAGAGHCRGRNRTSGSNRAAWIVHIFSGLPRSTLKEMTMAIGTVKFFNADKGYGFIQPDDGGNDAFVHISAVEASGMHTLDRDQRVNYELEQDRRGKMAAVRLSSAA